MLAQLFPKEKTEVIKSLGVRRLSVVCLSVCLSVVTRARASTVKAGFAKFGHNVSFDYISRPFFHFFFLRFFSDFVNMGVYGRRNFKRLLVLQFFTDQFQIFSSTTLDGP